MLTDGKQGVKAQPVPTPTGIPRPAKESISIFKSLFYLFRLGQVGTVEVSSISRLVNLRTNVRQKKWDMSGHGRDTNRSPQ